jgi:hypothetical protein
MSRMSGFPRLLKLPLSLSQFPPSVADVEWRTPDIRNEVMTALLPGKEHWLLFRMMAPVTATWASVCLLLDKDVEPVSVAFIVTRRPEPNSLLNDNVAEHSL